MAGKVILYSLILTLSLISVYGLDKARQERELLQISIDSLKDEISGIQATTYQMRSDIETFKYVADVGEEAITREVLFTEYGLWDGWSGTKTSSGLSIHDFEINELGMYTYQGDVVLGAAHESLGNVNKRFGTYELQQKIVFELNGLRYTGIVLDKCATCTWGNPTEDLQRFDVFTEQFIFGKVKGLIYE